MQIDYEEKGSGHPLVLLHGFCETKKIWRQIAGELSRHFRVIMPDLPGFGESGHLPQHTFAISEIAQTMLDWLDLVQVWQPAIIGHSLGGYVALGMARQSPERFPGIGLFHSTAAADPPEKKENRNKAISFVRKHGVEAYTDAFVPTLFHDSENMQIPTLKKDAAKTSLETLIGYAAAMRDRPSSLEFLSAYRKPVLLAAGEHDTLVTSAQLEEQARIARRPLFNVIKGAAHMGMLENELESINLVTKFMNFSAGN